MANTILVGIDYSESSANALREASRIAAARGARLVACFILDSDALAHVADSQGHLPAQILEDARASLANFVAKKLPEGTPQPEIQALIGHPFEGLLRLVEELDSNLLVLGARGLQHPPGHVGSIASRCVRIAPLPVLLVRSRQAGPFKQVIAAIDFSEESTHIAAQAFAIAAQDGAALTLAHVLIDPSTALAGFDIFAATMPDPMLPQRMEAAEKKLAALATEIAGDSPTIPISARALCSGSTSFGLLELIDSHPFDLIVLASRGRRGLNRLLLGTTAERLMHAAPCSTLVIKPASFQ
jgi:universal stress protein E